MVAAEAPRISDFAVWRRFATIENLNIDPPFVPLVPRSSQRRVGERITAADREGRPARLIILKSRRMGFSTVVQARLVHRAMTRPHFTGLTIAQEHEAASYLFGMAEGMYDRFPAELRVGKQRGNQGRLLSLANGSTLRTATAGTPESARSKGQRAVHASEVAFWPDPQRVMTALKQIVAPQPGTLFVLESTANGSGGYFHQQYLRAKAGLSEYEAIFAAWFEMEEFTLPGVGASLKGLSEHEEALLERGVSLDQLAWRRWKLETDLDGDERLFDQEYPWADHVAFLTSGRPFFAGLERLCPSPPWRVGRIEGVPVRGGGRLRFVGDELGALRVWESPRKGCRYVVAVDVAGLVTEREYEARKERDREDASCVQVIEMESGRQVASWHGRVDADELALEVARIGMLFNEGLVAVENTGGYGNGVLLFLDRQFQYPNLFRRRELDTLARGERSSLGWATTAATRPVMLDALRKVLRDAPSVVRCEATVDELRTFVVRPNGKPQAEPGCFDDRVMALAVAHIVRLEEYQRPIVLAAPRLAQVRSLVRRAPRSKVSL